MVSVPITSRGNVEVQPKGNGRFRYTAPRNFVGPAVEQFGNTLKGVANDVDAIEATYDEADALRVTNEHAAYERERLRTGENAYLTTQGFGAGEGREAAVADIKASAENLLGGARSERSRTMAKRALDVRLGNAEEAIGSHAVAQMNKALVGQSEARISGLTTDAVDARGTEQFDVNMGVADGELRKLAKRLGWSPEETEDKSKALAESIYSKEILAIDAEDGEPTAALARLDAVKDRLSEEVEGNLRNKLTPRVDTAWARGEVKGIVDSYVAAQPAPEPGKASSVVPGAAGEVGGELSKAGFSSAVVAGFLGNFEVEGGYGGAQGDGGTASGIAQWRHERRANFKKQFGKDPHRATPAEQAQFVVWEMKNPGAAGMTVTQRDAILNAQSPQEAAALIDQNYERSSGAHRTKRQEAAARLAGEVGAGGVPADPRLNSQNVQNGIEAYIAANPDISERRAEALRAAGDQFVSNARADRAQAEQDADRRLQDWLTNNMAGANDLTDMGQIPASILSGASPSTVASVQSRVQAANTRIQASRDSEAAARAEADERNAVFELYTLSDEELATIDMRRYAGRVGVEKLWPWIDRQQKAANGSAGTSVSTDRIASKIDTLGKSYGASRAPDASDEEKQAWTALRGFVEKRIAGRPNKDVTDEELRGIIVGGMTEVEVKGSGWIWNDSKPRAMMKPGEKFESTIPVSAKRNIEAALRARLRRDPREDEIFDAYQAGKARGAW